MVEAAIKLVHSAEPKAKKARAPKKVLTVAEQMAKLQAKQKKLVKGNVNELLARIDAVVALANEIADGGEAYPAGIRDIAERLAPNVKRDALNVEALRDRLLR